MMRDYFGQTAFHCACWRKRPGLEEVVDLLFRWGAEKSALDSDLETPADAISGVPIDG